MNSVYTVGWTPLHEAAISGHPSIVAKLLKHGADPNASGMDNDSPLHDAAANSHREVCKILVQYLVNEIILSVYRLFKFCLKMGRFVTNGT